MPASAFDSNIREIAAELKLMDKKFAAGIRKTIREVVAEGAASTTEAIKAGALAEGLHKAEAATSMKVSFSIRSGGAKVTTNKRIAPYARALEFGSKGAAEGKNRHPVFGSATPKGKTVQSRFAALKRYTNKADWTDQPTKPFFFKAVDARAPLTELLLIERANACVAFAGFTNI